MRIFTLLTFITLSQLACATQVTVPGSKHTQVSASEQAEVEKSVTSLTAAMISGDADALKAITMAELSYGHSSGNIETQAEFVQSIATGQSDFVAIDILKQSVQLNGNTALVRHDLDAKTNNSGQAGTVYLGVLLVLQKTPQGHWKLLARQAFKYPKGQG